MINFMLDILVSLEQANNTSLTNLFVYWKWMQTIQALRAE